MGTNLSDPDTWLMHNKLRKELDNWNFTYHKLGNGNIRVIVYGSTAGVLTSLSRTEVGLQIKLIPQKRVANYAFFGGDFYWKHIRYNLSFLTIGTTYFFNIEDAIGYLLSYWMQIVKAKEAGHIKDEFT
jgi:hypothetical protein